MSLHVDPDAMRSFQHREETGYLPDDVYLPTGEDDPYDPDQQEITALVVEQYNANNRKRWEQRTRDRITALESLLTEHGIEIKEI